MSTKTPTLYAFCLMALSYVATPLHAQTNFYDEVTQMWLNGQKQEVYSIATNRLASNTNDLAGLVMKLSYELECSSASHYTNTIQHLIAVGKEVSATNFASLYFVLPLERDIMDEMISASTTEELAQWAEKCSITNKPMTYRRFLKALEADGLLEN